MARLLLATLGTLGDVRPFIAIALNAVARGHQVRLATSPRFQALVEQWGLDFLPIGADGYLDRQEGRDALLDPVHGFDNFMRMSNLEPFEAIYRPLLAAARHADAIFATPFVMAAHLAAARSDVPLVLGVLSPASLRPAENANGLPPDFLTWRRLLNKARLELGLSSHPAPQMERLTAAKLVLGLYPEVLSDNEARHDLPLVELGYPLLHQVDDRLDSELAAWMDQGPFALFTFGSFVDRDAPAMLTASVAACRSLGLRCLYLSPYSSCRLGSSGPEVRIEGHLHHPLVMPRASVVVHHGGTGTLAEACEAGAAQVVVPFALDQVHNAQRLAAHGLGPSLPARAYEPLSLAACISAARAGPRPPPGSISVVRAAERSVQALEQALQG